jgi:hypothetical protein
MGTMLAWLSSKVLGQYEVFLPEEGTGRLVLVAPNIVETERRLGVDPSDFRMWVALHEVTHRTQFTAVPWMHAHVRSEIRALLESSSLDDPAELVGRRIVTIVPERYRQAHVAGFTMYLLVGRRPLLDRTVTLPALRRDGSEVAVRLTVRSPSAANDRSVLLADIALTDPE